MPSLILTGYPAAGKTNIAKILKERALLQPEIQNVVVINEENACPDMTKQQCYETSLAEKKTRAALKSAFDRSVSSSNKNTLVVLDSLNYIKGFRYELHCLSKAAGERHGILWILNQASVVETWNDERPESTKSREAYSTGQLRELILRYEPPDPRNRWDKPLYTVDVSPPGNIDDSKSEAVKRSVYNMHALEESLSPSNSLPVTTVTIDAPIEKLKKSAFSRAKRKTPKPVGPTSNNATDGNANQNTATLRDQPNAANDTQTKSLEEQLDEILLSFLSSKELKQGASTLQHVASSTNVLSGVDAITTQLVSAIVTAQSLHTGGMLQVPHGGSTHAMKCPRVAALPELRRMRRQYLQWVSTHPPDDTTEKGITQSFLRYLEHQLER